MDDVFVYLCELPNEINEMTVPCNGGYTVYIDSRLTYEGQLKAYRHALGHIETNDWERINVQEIEADAHSGR